MPDTGTRSLRLSGWDEALTDIADYVCDAEIDSDLAFETAHYCLMDTLACGFRALDYPACTRLLGPVVPGATLSGGARVPGTSYELEPVMAAFNIGAMIRWLDFNDTWLAAEWGHPSDNLGGILAVADYLSRGNRAAGRDPLAMRDVLTGMIRAHEIQGCLGLENSYNRVAQELGGRRCNQPRGAPGADQHGRRDGVPGRAVREGVGFLRRAVQGQSVQAAAALRQLRDGKHPVQDLLPRRIPRTNGGRGGSGAARCGLAPD